MCSEHHIKARITWIFNVNLSMQCRITLNKATNWDHRTDFLWWLFVMTFCDEPSLQQYVWCFIKMLWWTGVQEGDYLPANSNIIFSFINIINFFSEEGILIIRLIVARFWCPLLSFLPTLIGNLQAVTTCVLSWHPKEYMVPSDKINVKNWAGILIVIGCNYIIWL